MEKYEKINATKARARCFVCRVSSMPCDNALHCCKRCENRCNSGQRLCMSGYDVTDDQVKYWAEECRRDPELRKAVRDEDWQDFVENGHPHRICCV